MSVPALCRSRNELTVALRDAQDGLRPRPQPSSVSSSASTSSARDRARAPRRARGERRRVHRDRASRREARRRDRALLRLLGEQDSCAHRGGPRAAVRRRAGSRCFTQLTGAKRLVGEERELPAVQRLGELAVVVCQREPRAQVGGELRPRILSSRAGRPRPVAAIGRSGETRRAGSRGARTRRGRLRWPPQWRGLGR